MWVECKNKTKNACGIEVTQSAELFVGVGSGGGEVRAVDLECSGSRRLERSQCSEGSGMQWVVQCVRVAQLQGCSAVRRWACSVVEGWTAVEGDGKQWDPCLQIDGQHHCATQGPCPHCT